MNAISDHQYMVRALQLAARGSYTTRPNPCVGCVIVRDNEVVGEGWHQRAGGPHAEVDALARAGDRARGATVYVTLEPCCHHGRTPPCTEALINAGVRRVVAAMPDPNPAVAGQGIERLRAAGITVETGMCESQAGGLNPGHIMHAIAGRPYVRCKIATTLDGHSATATGESKWITSAEARRDVQRFRARSSAIMTGSGTLLADDPRLDVRANDLIDTDQEVAVNTIEPPWRIIIDSGLKTPSTASVFSTPGRILIASAGNGPDDARRQLLQKGAMISDFPGSTGRVELTSVMKYVSGLQINEVLLEAGPTLNGAMLQAGLIDEFIFYVAPRLLGDTGRGLFHLPGLDSMKDIIDLDISDIRPVGRDWRIIARIHKLGI